MPELSKWIRAERNECSDGKAMGMEEDGAPCWARKLRDSCQSLLESPKGENSLAKRNMEFIKRFVIYRINWIGKANTLNKSGAKLVKPRKWCISCVIYWI